MINKVKSLYSRPLIRNIGTVASGTAVAQAISMAFAPMVTRLYGPEAYGLTGIFISIVGLLATAAALGYPTAIVLPLADADAIGLVRLSLYVGIGMSILTAIIFSLFGNEILNLLNAEAISAYAYLFPVAIVISVIGAVLRHWLIRKKAYKLVAKYSVLTASILGVVKLTFGFFCSSALVLIAANVSGSIFGSLFTFMGWRRLSTQKASVQGYEKSQTSIIELALRHRDFPLLRTPQNLLNIFSQSLPVLLLATYFGASSAGQYTLVRSVMGLPAVLIGGSVMAVFYPRITDAIRNGEDACKLIVRATAGLAAVGALPFLVVIVAGPFLFSFIFGEKWHTAGVFAQWLSLWLFFQYINKPAVSAIPSLKLQGGLLVYEVFSTGTKVLALWIGFTYFNSEVAAVALFSISGVIAYVWLILWVVRHSRKKQSLENERDVL